MVQGASGEPIQRDVARRLCAQIMAQRRRKWWTPAAWRCWGCAWLSRGEPTQLRFAASPDNRGCQIINERWEQTGRPYR